MVCSAVCSLQMCILWGIPELLCKVCSLKYILKLKKLNTQVGSSHKKKRHKRIFDSS